MKRMKCILILLMCCFLLFSCTPANNAKAINEPEKRILWDRCCVLPTDIAFESFEKMYEAIKGRELFDDQIFGSDRSQKQAVCHLTYDAIWTAGTVPRLLAYQDADMLIGDFLGNEYYIKPMTEEAPVTIYTAFEDPMNEDRNFRVSFQVKDSILVEQYNTMDKSCRFEIQIEEKKHVGLYWKTEDELDLDLVTISHVAVDYGNYVLLLEGVHLGGEKITAKEMCEVLHRLVIHEENLWEPQPVC